MPNSPDAAPLTKQEIRIKGPDSVPQSNHQDNDISKILRDHAKSPLERLKTISDKLGSDLEAQAKEMIGKELKAVGLKENNSGMVDLSQLSNQEIMVFFDRLVQSGKIVLHGSNSEQPLKTLVAQQSFDTTRESGNQKAVYAASSPSSTLTRAVLNREYLNSKGGYSLGEVFDGERKVFKADPQTFLRITNGDTQVFKDGYVYILDKSSFQISKDDATEYSSYEDQVPLIVFKVPARIGSELFVTGRGTGIDTLTPYTPQEQRENQLNVSQRQQEIDDRRRATVLTGAIFNSDNEVLTGEQVAAKLSLLPGFQSDQPNPKIEEMLGKISQIPRLDQKEFVNKMVEISKTLSPTELAA